MTLSKSKDGIGAVTALILDKLSYLETEVKMGAPKDVVKEFFKLFLYEITIDPEMRNYALSVRQPTPLWLILKYILISPTKEDNSDFQSLKDLGYALRILYDMNFLEYSQISPSNDKFWIREALEDNPEQLKLTFDPTPVDLVSKLMGSVNDQYNTSICFQIRPIMIMSARETIEYRQIGKDIITGEELGEEGIIIDVNILKDDLRGGRPI